MIAASLNTPEQTIGFLAITVVAALLAVQLVRWFCSGPIRPDPWNDEVAAELANADSLPMCHRCLTNHNGQVDFCPKCGAPVGLYTNLLPFPYLFSIGHTLRLGTAGEFKHSPLTAIGFLLFSVVQYAVFAPVYWFVFLKKLLIQSPSPAEVEKTPRADSKDFSD